MVKSKKEDVQHQQEEKSPWLLINEKELENHVEWLGYGIITCLITGGFFGLEAEWAQIAFALGGGITVYAGVKSYKLLYERRLHQYKRSQQELSSHETDTIAQENEEEVIVRQKPAEKPAIRRPRVAAWKQATSQRNNKRSDLSDEKTYWKEYERLKTAIVTTPKRFSTHIANFFWRSNADMNVIEDGKDLEKETHLNEKKEQRILSYKKLQKKQKTMYLPYPKTLSTNKITPVTNDPQDKTEIFVQVDNRRISLPQCALSIYDPTPKKPKKEKKLKGKISPLIGNTRESHKNQYQNSACDSVITPISTENMQSSSTNDNDKKLKVSTKIAAVPEKENIITIEPIHNLEEKKADSPRLNLSQKKWEEEERERKVNELEKENSELREVNKQKNEALEKKEEALKTLLASHSYILDKLYRLWSEKPVRQFIKEQVLVYVPIGHWPFYQCTPEVNTPPYSPDASSEDKQTIEMKHTGV